MATAQDLKQTTLPQGYKYGSKDLVKSPFSLSDLTLLQQSALFGEEDTAALRRSYEILKDQTDAILDMWYGFVGATPQLVYFFGNKHTGAPDTIWR